MDEKEITSEFVRKIETDLPKNLKNKIDKTMAMIIRGDKLNVNVPQEMSKLVELEIKNSVLNYLFLSSIKNFKIINKEVCTIDSNKMNKYLSKLGETEYNHNAPESKNIKHRNITFGIYLWAGLMYIIDVAFWVMSIAMFKFDITLLIVWASGTVILTVGTAIGAVLGLVPLVIMIVLFIQKVGKKIKRLKS